MMVIDVHNSEVPFDLKLAQSLVCGHKPEQAHSCNSFRFEPYSGDHGVWLVPKSAEAELLGH